MLGADTQRLREKQANYTHRDTAQCRPPHPVDRQALEEVFHNVNALAEKDRHQARTQAKQREDRQIPAVDGESGHRKKRRRALHKPAQSGRRRAGQRHRQQGTHAELEQQQFDSQKQSRHGGIEGCRHASGGARHDKHLALRRGRRVELAEQRSEGSAGLNDRPFRAERAAGANGDSGRQRFEDGQLWSDPATGNEDGLHGLGNAVAANMGRTVPRQQADDEPA